MTSIELTQAALAYLTLCALVVVVSAKLAKPGWQDDRGFHSGDEHADDNNLGI